MEDAVEGVEDRIAALMNEEGAIPEGTTTERKAPAAELPEAEAPVEPEEDLPEGADKPTTEGDPADSGKEDDAEADAEAAAKAAQGAPRHPAGLTDAELDTLYSVKVQGKVEQVPLREVLSGYMKQQDYTRKNMALADDRRAVLEERAHYADSLGRLDAAIRATLGPEPDWDRMRAENPVEYGIQYAERDRQKQRLTAIQQEQARIQEMTAHEAAARLTAHVEEQRERLLQARPEWSDPERMKADTQAIREYGTRIGFTEDELDNAYDSRAVLVLDKARQWDALQERKLASVKEAEAREPKPRPVKPGSAPGRKVSSRRMQYNDRRAALRRSGSAADAARALEFILPDD